MATAGEHGTVFG